MGGGRAEGWVTDPGGEIRRGNTMMHPVLSASALPSCFTCSPALQVGHQLPVQGVGWGGRGVGRGCRKVKGLGWGHTACEAKVSVGKHLELGSCTISQDPGQLGRLLLQNKNHLATFLTVKVIPVRSFF